VALHGNDRLAAELGDLADADLVGRELDALQRQPVLHALAGVASGGASCTLGMAALPEAVGAAAPERSACGTRAGEEQRRKGDSLHGRSLAGECGSSYCSWHRTLPSRNSWPSG